jgi:hypothetical protein
VMMKNEVNGRGHELAQMFFGINNKSKDIEMVQGIEIDQELENEEFIDPQIAELRERVGLLEQGIKLLRESNAQRVIDDFRLAEDEVGELLHPHFEELKGIMADLILSQHVDSLDGAYLMADRIQGNNCEKH